MLRHSHKFVRRNFQRTQLNTKQASNFNWAENQLSPKPKAQKKRHQPENPNRPVFSREVQKIEIFETMLAAESALFGQGGYYRILCVSERFLSLILLGGEILRAAAEITCSQSWDYRLRSQKEQLLGKAECLANCSVCIGLL